MQCPWLKTTVDRGATNSTDCKCQPGYLHSRQHSGALCSPCEKGKYKSWIGDQACQDCPEHSTSGLEGRTHVRHCTCSPDRYGLVFNGGLECLECPLNSRTHPFLEPAGDRSDCLCEPGFFFGATSCQPCPPGTYKDHLGQATACDSCPAGATSREASTSHMNCSCPFGFQRNTDRSCSMCLSGKYLQAGDCLDCPRNSNSKSGSEGSESCACRENFFKTTQGECSACPANSISPDGSLAVADCRCNAGYYAQRRQTTQALICKLCPHGSSSPSGSENMLNCSCEAGYAQTVDGGSCLACEAGTYKQEEGQGSCSTCPANTYSEGSANTACSLCPMGTESDMASTSAESCICPINQYGTRFVGCQLCPPHSREETGRATQSSDCECQPGYSGLVLDQVLECVRCSSGKYKQFWGNDICSECGQHETSPQASTSVSNCLCIPGYIKTHDGCLPCPPNTIKPGLGDGTECSSCPENSVKRAEAQICECR